MAVPSCPYKKGDLLTFTPSERTISDYQDVSLFGLTPSCVYQLRKIKDNLYLYFDEGGGFSYGEFRRALVEEIKMGNNTLEKKYQLNQKRLQEKKNNFFSRRRKQIFKLPDQVMKIRASSFSSAIFKIY